MYLYNRDFVNCILCVIVFYKEFRTLLKEFSKFQIIDFDIQNILVDLHIGHQNALILHSFVVV
jgi:hypothetical protein